MRWRRASVAADRAVPVDPEVLPEADLAGGAPEDATEVRVVPEVRLLARPEQRITIPVADLAVLREEALPGAAPEARVAVLEAREVPVVAGAALALAVEVEAEAEAEASAEAEVVLAVEALAAVCNGTLPFLSHRRRPR